MKTPEGYEKDDITKYLESLGTSAWFFKPYMAGYGKSGVSDIVGCKRTLITSQMVGSVKGLWFSSEVKRPSKEPTPIQWRRMAEIEAAGGKTFWGTAEKVIPEFEAWIS